MLASMQFNYYLEDILKNNPDQYFGQTHHVSILGGNFSFVRGLLTNSPRQYQHALFNVNKKQPACYALLEIGNSRRLYVGSSGHIYHRIVVHKLLIGNGKHDNSNFRELLKSRNMSDFALLMIFTQDREEAYRLEQHLVDRYKETDQLLNIAHDVRAAWQGRTFTDEHRRRISESNLGKVMSDEARSKISKSRKVSETAINQLAEVHARKRRSVCVNGTIFPSVTLAAKFLGIGCATVLQRASAKDSGVVLIDPPKSKVAGIARSQTVRKNMSLGRKSPKALAQLESVREKQRSKIVLNGVLYPSVREAVKQTGISEATIHRQIRSNKIQKVDGFYTVNYTRPRR